MHIPGRHISRHRLIQSARYVVDVPVELVFPEDEPSEPCYDAETIQLLKEIQEHADAGDVDWLRHHGKVYEAVQS